MNLFDWNGNKEKEKSGSRFNSIKKGSYKRPEKGRESTFPRNICMNYLNLAELQ